MSERVRLLHIVSSEMSLRPFFAGQARFMAAQGIDVTLCSPPTDDACRFAIEENARFLPCDLERTIAPWRDLKSIARLSLEMRNLSPHIVHAHGLKASLIGLIAARLSHTPVRICHVHGLPFLSDTQPQQLLRSAMRATCALANRVLSVSSSMARELVAANCCPAEKVVTPLDGSINGIDAISRFNPHHLPAGIRQRLRTELGISSDAFVIGFIGRIVVDKGFNELLAAWNQLRLSHSNIHLLVAGPLEERNGISDSARTQLISDPRIHWLGEDRDTPRLYAAMDLLALPSYREGLGLVLLEAGAMGLPVIATDIPGCIDALKDGVTGTLVPPRDAGSLALAISKYLESPIVCELHGRNGRAWVLSHFQPQAMWEAIFREYAALLKRRGIPLPAPNVQLHNQAA